MRIELLDFCAYYLSISWNLSPFFHANAYLRVSPPGPEQTFVKYSSGHVRHLIGKVSFVTTFCSYNLWFSLSFLEHISGFLLNLQLSGSNPNKTPNKHVLYFSVSVFSCFTMGTYISTSIHFFNKLEGIFIELSTIGKALWLHNTFVIGSVYFQDLWHSSFCQLQLKLTLFFSYHDYNYCPLTQ